MKKLKVFLLALFSVSLSGAVFAAPSAFQALLNETAVIPSAGSAGAAPAVPTPLKTVAVSRVAQPDWSVTPGALCTPDDPNFKEYRYPEHIAYCNRNVTKQMKLDVAGKYGVPQSDWHSYEFDHLLPLCIGGDSSEDNLWPEPHGATESDGKDKLEYQLYKEISSGSITQANAVKQIYSWFGRYVQKHPELPVKLKAELLKMTGNAR